jgi:hypothetical protein
MVQENEDDPTGMNRGAKTTSHNDDGHTHTNGHGSAQDREWAEYYSPASHRPDIEAIEIRPGVVNIYDVKIRDVGTVAVEAEQLADFRRFNCACIDQVQRCFDPPPSELAWNRHIDAALRKAVRLEQVPMQTGETLHLHDAPNWGAPKQAPKREKTAQFVLKKVLARMLDRQGVEIKAEGKDAVRAVCEDEVRTVFEADYIATHTDSSDVGQAWRRARNHPAAGVTGDVVNGVPYLWRSVPYGNPVTIIDRS